MKRIALIALFMLFSVSAFALDPVPTLASTSVITASTSGTTVPYMTGVETVTLIATEPFKVLVGTTTVPLGLYQTLSWSRKVASSWPLVIVGISANVLVTVYQLGR